MKIRNVLDWLQEAEDNDCWHVSTQSVKRHLEQIVKVEITANELSHYESLKKQDTEHRKLIRKLQEDVKEAYNKGYEEGANAAANDIMSSI